MLDPRPRAEAAVNNAVRWARGPDGGAAAGAVAVALAVLALTEEIAALRDDLRERT